MRTIQDLKGKEMKGQKRDKQRRRRRRNEGVSFRAIVVLPLDPECLSTCVFP